MYVIPYLAHPQDKVAIQAMAFLAALVYKGFKVAQQYIGLYLKTRDNQLFTRMDAILKLAAANIKDAPPRSVTHSSRV